MLDFEEEELSGHLVADGDKGQYWVMELTWTELELINATPGGPDVVKLGSFHSPEEAIDFANHWDRGVEDKAIEPKI